MEPEINTGVATESSKVTNIVVAIVIILVIGGAAAYLYIDTKNEQNKIRGLFDSDGKAIPNDFSDTSDDLDGSRDSDNDTSRRSNDSGSSSGTQQSQSVTPSEADTIAQEAPTDAPVATSLASFTTSLNACASSVYTRSTTADVFGSSVDTSVTYQVIPGSCSVKVTLNSYAIRPSDELLEYLEESGEAENVDIEAAYAEATAQAAVALGTSGVCSMTSSKGEFSAFLNINVSDTSYGDAWLFASAEEYGCSGELFTLMAPEE